MPNLIKITVLNKKGDHLTMCVKYVQEVLYVMDFTTC